MEHIAEPARVAEAHGPPRRRPRGLVAVVLAGVVLAALLVEHGQPRTARADGRASATPSIRPVGGTGVFSPDERPRFTVADLARGTGLAWRIHDSNGTVVASGAERSAPESLEVAPTNDFAAGVYRLTVEATGAPTSSFRFVRVIAGPAATDPFFGVVTSPAAAVLPTLDALGAGAYRQDLQWTAVEKVAGRFDFTAVDARIDPIVRDRGISPLFVLDYGHVSYTGGAMTPPDMAKPAQAAAWKRYVQQTVAHMRERHPDADLSYEVWNEWTNTHGPLPSTPAAYIELASVTAQVIRQTDPDATIVGPTQNSVSTKERAWLAEWFALGGADHVDAVSVHPYNQPWAPEQCTDTAPCFEDSLAWLRDAADQHPRDDGTPLPIWITEFGWPTQFGGAGWVQPEDQTAYLLRATAIAAQYGVERMFLFELAEPDRADPNGLPRTFGLTTSAANGYEPKPSAAGWATMQRLLADKQFVSEHRTDAVRELRFASADGRHHVSVIWQTAAHGSVSTTVELPGSGRLVEPTGAEKTVRGTGGTLAMSAKWIPRFVVWDD